MSSLRPFVPKSLRTFSIVFLQLILLVTSFSATPVQAQAAAPQSTTPAGQGSADAADAPGGTWQCLNQGGPDPCLNNIHGAAALTASDIWAVGGAGTILHYDGAAWQKQASPVASKLSAVAFASADAGWAVGENGTILRWNGSAWKTQNTPTTVGLKALAVVNENDVWAVGGDSNEYLTGSLVQPGIVLHWDGSHWAENNPTGVNLNEVNFQDVAAPAANDLWVIDSQYTFYHWDGSQWTQDIHRDREGSGSGHTLSRLTALSFLSPSAGWAVGYSDYSNRIMTWNGETWSVAEDELPKLPGETRWRGTLYDIAMRSPTDGWAIGDPGELRHWDGEQWSDVNPFNHDSIQFTAILPISAQDVWAFGAGGIIQHWDGQTWTQAAGLSQRAISSIAMTSPANGWAIQRDLFNLSQNNLLHWNGVRWETVANPTNKIPRAVAMLSAADGWIVGDEGLALRWDGSAWKEFPLPTQTRHKSVKFISANDGWMVGQDILHWDGEQWSEVDFQRDPFHLTFSSFNDIAVLSATDAWAIGYVANYVTLVYHWDGESWQAWDGIDAEHVGNTSIWMAAPDKGWIVDYGLIASYTHEYWEPMASFFSPTIYLAQINGGSVNSLFTVGYAYDVSDVHNGRMLRYHPQGDAWETETLGASSGLSAIQMRSDHEGWVGGENSLFLRYVPDAPVVESNAAAGAPGSHFTLSGAGYAPHQRLALRINGPSPVQTLSVQTDDLGFFNVDFNTAGLKTGDYTVQLQGAPSAPAAAQSSFPVTLDKDAPLIAAESSALPETGLFEGKIYLPFLQH
jgi:photosystem II stability/assembly factor-like uncharacterized protein